MARIDKPHPDHHAIPTPSKTVPVGVLVCRVCGEAVRTAPGLPALHARSYADRLASYEPNPAIERPDTRPTRGADEVIRLTDLSGLPYRIAAAMIARHGVYTFTDATTGAKVKVIR